jgi:hypothetical protein
LVVTSIPFPLGAALLAVEVVAGELLAADVLVAACALPPAVLELLELLPHPASKAVPAITGTIDRSAPLLI